jgi:predicted dehydrogenase
MAKLASSRAVIRLGVIGAGLAFDRLHWPVLQKMPDRFRVTAVASRTRERSETVAQTVGGARVYDEYRQLLQDPEVDAILVAVPIEINHSVLIDAMRSGKHVLAEKPIAATPQEAEAVLAAVSTSAVIAIAENYRYRKDLARAKEILSKGLIGEVFAFDLSVKFDLDNEVRRGWTEKAWRRDPRHPGGFLLDAGVHSVSFLRDLLGEVSEVYAQALDRHLVIGGPDSLLMQMRLGNGIIGQYFTCYTAKVAEETLMGLSVFASCGTLNVSLGKVSWSQGVGKPHGAFRIPKTDRGYTRQWENFANAIHGKEPLVSTLHSAYRDLLVIDAALRSAATGQKVMLPA